MQTIFLHGLGQTAASWEGVLSAMRGQTEVLCPNLPDLLQGPQADYAQLYQAFSASCGEGPRNLCGLSLGGILALQYTLEHPDQVSALVLIGTQFVMPKGLLRLQSLIFHLMPARAFSSAGLSKRDFLQLTGSMVDLDFRRQLEGIRCPVLVVCGERDRPNRRAAQELARQIPHAQLHLLPGAGHEVNAEAPQALAALLDDFFASVNT